MNIPLNQDPNYWQKYLMEKALSYLARYQTTEVKLARYLKRQILKKTNSDDPLSHPEADAAVIPTIISYLRAKGYLNDQDFIDLKITQYRRQGRSSLWIKAKLQSMGLMMKAIESSLQNNSYDTDDDASALIIFAKRKRIGPYRLKKSAENYKKDYQRLRRSGFSKLVVDRLLNAPARPTSTLDQSDIDD